MKNPKNEILNKAADENMITGVLDITELSDDIIAKVSGGTFEQNTVEDGECRR